MEQLNRIELIGTIGQVRLTEVADTRLARFSVATNVAYRSKEGAAVIETTCYPKTIIIKT